MCLENTTTKNAMFMQLLSVDEFGISEVQGPDPNKFLHVT